MGCAAFKAQRKGPCVFDAARDELYSKEKARIMQLRSVANLPSPAEGGFAQAGAATARATQRFAE